jgi:hypothetical protein
MISCHNCSFKGVYVLCVCVCVCVCVRARARACMSERERDGEDNGIFTNIVHLTKYLPFIQLNWR